MIKIRKFEPEHDFEGLVRLRIAIEAFDQTGSDVSEKSLHDQFKWPGHERWVVDNTADNSLIGHAWAFTQSESRTIFQLFIDPEFRRQGWGKKLLDQVVTHIKQSGVSQIVTGANAANSAGISFLDTIRFAPVGNNRFFEAAADVSVDQPIWPDGFSVKSCEELGDLSKFIIASNACYADMWGHRENTEPQSMEHIEKLNKRFPDLYNLAGIFILFDQNNEVAGLTFNRLDGEARTKVIDSPGVVPKHRHLGLQRPLVQHSMYWLNQQTSGKYHLHTFGDFEEAVEIYKDLGFTLADEDHLIEYLLLQK